MSTQTQLDRWVRGRGNVITIHAEQRVSSAARVMTDNHVGCLVVVDGQEAMVGIVTERDILRWVGNASPETYSALVGDIMATEVVSCEPGTPIEEAHRIMVEHGVRHLPIVEDGAPVGILSSRDVMGQSLDL